MPAALIRMLQPLLARGGGDAGQGLSRCKVARDQVCGTALRDNLFSDLREGVLIPGQEQNTSAERRKAQRCGATDSA